MTASNDLVGVIGGRSAQMLSGQCVQPSYLHHSHSFRKSDGLSLKTLLRIRPRDWQAIRDRVVSHAHEAIPSSLTTTSGSEKHSNSCSASTIATTTNSNHVYTPLHDAIQKNAPSDVIKAIIQAYPQALFMGNEFNRTPLVLACDDCLIRDSVVMALLEEQTKLSQQKHWPTFVEGSDDNFITSTSKGAKFASWLSYAFPREYGQVHSGPENERAMTFRSNIGRYVPSGGYTPSPSRRSGDGCTIRGDDRDAPPRLPVSSSLHRFWRLLLLELRAPWVFGHSSSLFSGGELPREVHAVISAQCPVPVVGLAAHLHPSQLREENGAGDLPLHIACRQRSASYATTYNRKGEEQQTERSVSVSCHQNKRSRCIQKQQTQEHSPTTIDVLVTAFPEAASIPARDGSMPLNMALAAGNTWRQGGVMSLHNAAPYVLGQRDVNTGLFPFMQAACANSEDQTFEYSDDEASGARELDRVETIFHLLRALPEVLAGEE